MIHAHANAGDAAKAQGWLDSMRARGVPADAVCFNSVCAAHARRGDVASASVCFRAMEEAGVCASPQTYAILVHALVKSGDADRAEATLRELIGREEPLEASRQDEPRRVERGRDEPEPRGARAERSREEPEPRGAAGRSQS